MTESMSSEKLHALLAELTDRELSRPSRYGHLALTVVAVIMALMLAGLLLTEELPPRTLGSLWCLLGIACAWAAFGWRVLSRRRPLLANREVIAGTMAVAFSSLFTAGAMAFGSRFGAGAFTGVAWLGLTMTLVAIAVLVRACLRRSGLKALRTRLERELSAP